LKQSLIEQIADIRSGKTTFHKDVTHPTIFQELLTNPNIPDSEKTDDRLGDEALVVISAGLSTTAAALTTSTYYLAERPKVHDRLLQEFKEAGVLRANGDLNAEKLNRNTLEKLPYLFGVIHEAIRLSGGGVGVRLTRIAPDQDLVYKEWVIPRGTAVSMSQLDILLNEDIFEDALEFKPERWFGEPGKELEKKGWVPFGRGSRMCLGMK
jgi:cytochrome P450